jgi:hypothetical protein
LPRDTPFVVVAADVRGGPRRGTAQIARTPSDRQQMGPTTGVNAYNDLHCKRQFSKR